MIDLGTVFIFLALLLLVAIFVSRPLLDHQSASVSEEEMTYSSLMAERDRILAALQELDFDQTMGKIPAEDYQFQRSELLRQGAAVLRSLDELQEGAPDQAVDARLEAAIASRRAEAEGAPPLAAAAVPTAVGINDDDIENMISARRQDRSGKATGFCHRCGHPIQQHDRFCAKCGATI